MESNSHDAFALSEINDSNFSGRVYLPPFSRYLSVENLSIRIYVFDRLYFFFFYQSPSPFCAVFDAISSYIDEFLSMNPCSSVSVFGDFDIHHKD